MCHRAWRIVTVAIYATTGWSLNYGQDNGSPHTMHESAQAEHQQAKSTPPITPPPGAILPDVLVVDNRKISVNDILEPLGPVLDKMAGDELPASYYNDAARLVRAQIVEQVAQHLIWRRAQEHVTDEMKPAIDKAVAKMEKDRINREFGGRETLYEKHLTDHKMTRDEVKEKLKRSLLIDTYLRDRLLPQVPPPRRQELLDYYQKNQADFSQAERRELLLIDIPAAAFLETGKWATKAAQEAADKEARARIHEAEAALKRGEKFEDVAKKYSEGLHASEGGSWGMITAPEPGKAALQGHWEVPSRKLFEMAPGQTSEIIEAAKSFFIVKVGKYEPGKLDSFQEAQPEISSKLRQERFMKLRAQFLQAELEKSTIGSLEDFVTRVMQSLPPPRRT